MFRSFKSIEQHMGRLVALTPVQMAELDRRMIEHYHIELPVMMENAGKALAEQARRLLVVFINFWATWCAFCLAEMPDIQQVHEEFEDSLVVLGINRAESIEQQKRFLDNLDRDIAYILLLDPTDSVASLYGVRAMPTSYIVNHEGVITDRFLGQISITEMRQAILDAGERGGKGHLAAEEKRLKLW